MSGVLLLFKEEKYIILYNISFPSFLRRGVMTRQLAGMTGWLF
jgi:hypothetical protein